MNQHPLDPYNEQTRGYFANPVHAGDLDGEYTRTAVASVAESAAGARLTLAVGLTAQRIDECRFRAFGCPHLIAAAERWCEASEGKTPVDLLPFDVTGCMQILGVPVEKTGRILLLEDAVGLLVAQIDGRLTQTKD